MKSLVLAIVVLSFSVSDLRAAPRLVGCTTTYSATTMIDQTIRGDSPAFGVAEDIHLGTATSVTLCSFDVAFENGDPANAHGMWVSFRKGGTGNPVPGEVTAGPFHIAIDAAAGTRVYHVDAGLGYVTPDAYIDFQWDDSSWPAIPFVQGPSPGSTHTYLYFSDGNYFFPFSAGLYAVVQTGEAVPASVQTWGSVKARYR